jgi:AraC-like DNA-binding protein
MQDPIQLINAAIVAVSIQGSLVIWNKKGFRGISLFMLLVACAALFNLLETNTQSLSGAILSPLFQLVFGPALFLACRGLTGYKFSNKDLLHFLPFLAAIIFAKHLQLIIAIGSISRIVYSLFTASYLIQYKRSLDAERSDSDEYSFQWLVWLILITAAFNFFDLIRLNTQPFIPLQINLIGQLVNNSLWLFVIMFLTYQLNLQKDSPEIKDKSNGKSTCSEEGVEEFREIFAAIEHKVKSEELFRTERLTLTQLSNQIGLQSRDVSRAINLVKQKSFNEYINTMRIDYVCQSMNRNGNESIIELAFDAGFSSKAVFNRSFKHITGLTPTQYRSKITS